MSTHDFTGGVPNNMWRVINDDTDDQCTVVLPRDGSNIPSTDDGHQVIIRRSGVLIHSGTGPGERPIMADGLDTDRVLIKMVQTQPVSDIHIEGIHFVGGRRAIEIDGAEDITITSCIFDNHHGPGDSCGIFTDDTNSISLLGNLVIDCGDVTDNRDHGLCYCNADTTRVTLAGNLCLGGRDGWQVRGDDAVCMQNVVIDAVISADMYGGTNMSGAIKLNPQIKQNCFWNPLFYALRINTMKSGSLIINNRFAWSQNPDVNRSRCLQWRNNGGATMAEISDATILNNRYRGFKHIYANLPTLDGFTQDIRLPRFSRSDLDEDELRRNWSRQEFEKIYDKLMGQTTPMPGPPPPDSDLERRVENLEARVLHIERYLRSFDR